MLAILLWWTCILSLPRAFSRDLLDNLAHIYSIIGFDDPRLVSHSDDQQTRHDSKEIE
jgi:hypothetical protein